MAFAMRAVRPYEVLLPAGLAMPPALPPARCALAAPFHPYPGMPGRYHFCGAVPGVAPAGGYPAPFFHGARTFLSPRGERPSGRLARGELGRATAAVKRLSGSP